MPCALREYVAPSGHSSRQPKEVLLSEYSIADWEDIVKLGCQTPAYHVNLVKHVGRVQNRESLWSHGT